MKELKQRHLLSRKEFYLRPSGIRVITKNWKEELEYRIKYEDLGLDLVKKRERAFFLPACGLALVCGLSLAFALHGVLQPTLTGATLGWLGAAALSLVLARLGFWRAQRQLVSLTGGAKTLELFQDQPSAATVEAFVLSIKARRNAYFKAKYGRIEAHLPQDVQLERFGWLRDMGILTAEEHTDLWMQLQIKDLLS